MVESNPGKNNETGSEDFTKLVTDKWRISAIMCRDGEGPKVAPTGIGGDNINVDCCDVSGFSEFRRLGCCTP